MQYFLYETKYASKNNSLQEILVKVILSLEFHMNQKRIGHTRSLISPFLTLQYVLSKNAHLDFHLNFNRAFKPD